MATASTSSSSPKVCANCGRGEANPGGHALNNSSNNNLKQCTQCKSVFYCSRDCQRGHWSIHKPQCCFWIKNLDPDKTYVNDETATHMAAAQERTFLSSNYDATQPPAIGQRVELGCSIKKTGRSFEMSGQVVKVLPAPTIKGPLWHFESSEQQQTQGLSHRLFKLLSLNDGFPEICPESITMRDQISDAVRDEGFTGENLYCPCGSSECIPGNVFMGVWINSSPEFKDRCLQTIIDKYGSLHGQQVIVQARLSFNDDERRSRLEGPTWPDGIMVDGRDIWEYTLQMDDFRTNQWCPVLGSFRNLGRNVQPRCWPWTMSSELPYKYKFCCTECESTRPHSRNVCLGPFGCFAAGHTHGQQPLPHRRLRGVDENGNPLPPDNSGAA